MSLNRKEWIWWPWFYREPKKRWHWVFSASGPIHINRSPTETYVSSILARYLINLNENYKSGECKKAPQSHPSSDSGCLSHTDNEEILSGNSSNYQVVCSGQQKKQTVQLRQGHVEQDEMRLLLDALTCMMVDLKSVVDSYYCPSGDVEKALRLLPLASRLRMPSVIRDCDIVLRRGLTVTNCISTFKLAKELEGLNELQAEARKFILLHFSRVWKESPDVSDLSLEELQSLLLSNELTVDEEENIFEAIVRWIQTDQQSRKEHIQDLVDAVRLPCCRKEFLTELLTHPLTGDCPAVVTRVKTLLHRSELDPDRATRLCHQLRRPRPPDKEVIYALGGRTSSIYDVSSFETLDPHTQTWTCRTDVHDQPRGETAILPIGNEILVVEMDSERVRSFEPLTLTWQHRSPLPLHLNGTSIAAIGNNVYIMGGYNWGIVTNKCFVYNYLTDTWKSQPNLRNTRSRSSSTTFKGKIYCSGGRTQNHETINNVESIDPEQGYWMDEEPMIYSRWGHSMVTCSNYLWAFGGCQTTSSLSEVERYHPDTGQWIRMQPMPTARRSLSVTTFEGRFYVIGGIHRGKPLTTTEVYDPESNTWERRSEMCKARAVLGTCAFRNGKEGPRSCHGVVCRDVERIKGDTARLTGMGDLLLDKHPYRRRRRTRST